MPFIIFRRAVYALPDGSGTFAVYALPDGSGALRSSYASAAVMIAME